MDTNQASSSFDTQEADPLADFVKLPGFLPRWEIPHVIREGQELYVEHAGKLDQIDVYRVYTRTPKAAPQPADDEDDKVGLAVGLWFEGEAWPVPARLLPLSSEAPLMAVLAIDKKHAESAIISRLRSYLAGSRPVNGPRAHRTAATASRGVR